MRSQHRTLRSQRSREAEIRTIPGSAVHAEGLPAGGLGGEIAARFEGYGLTEDVPELRGFAVDLPPVNECLRAGRPPRIAMTGMGN